MADGRILSALRRYIASPEWEPEELLGAGFTPSAVAGPYKKILVIHPNFIGDVAGITPIIRELARRYRGAEIHFLAEENSAPVLENNPYIKKTIIFRQMELLTLIRSGKISEADRYLSAFLRRLRSEEYGLVINFSYWLRYCLIAGQAAAAGSAARTGLFLTNGLRPEIYGGVWDFYMYNLIFDKSLKARGLLSGFDINSRRVCVSTLRSSPELFLSRAEKKEFRASFGGLLAERGAGLVGLVPGAQREVKMWEAGKYAEFIKLLHKREKIKAVLFGSEAEKGLCSGINRLAGGKAVDLSGRTNLRQLMYLLGRCSCVIGSDTASAHLASALGVPVIVIGGPTMICPAGRRNNLFIYGDVDCLACGYFSKCKDKKCMAKVTPSGLYDIYLVQKKLVIKRRPSPALVKRALRGIEAHYSVYDRALGYAYLPLGGKKTLPFGKLADAFLDASLINSLSGLDGLLGRRSAGINKASLLKMLDSKYTGLYNKKAKDSMRGDLEMLRRAAVVPDEDLPGRLKGRFRLFEGLFASGAFGTLMGLSRFRRAVMISALGYYRQLSALR